FQIPRALFEGALERKALLETGAIRYKAIDPNFGPRVNSISNCIHAITDMDPSSVVFTIGNLDDLAKKPVISRPIRCSIEGPKSILEKTSTGLRKGSDSTNTQSSIVRFLTTDCSCSTDN